MFALLARLFIKRHRDYARPEVRRAYGTLCTVYAIALNLLLAGVKLATGILCGSFAIRADAVNNFTDVGSSLLLAMGFYFAGMRPSPERPFGHGRIEYVAGFVVSVLVIVCGVETARESFRHILHPSDVAFSWPAVAILAFSIAVKFYMCFLMYSTARRIDSEALRATGVDSLGDTLSTFAALLGMVVLRLSQGRLNLDGWLGLFVGALILKTGVSSARGTLGKLLGTKPSPELIARIRDICLDHDLVIGIHDLIVHDYGPGRLHVSVHCEVPSTGDICEIHEVMDHIMNELDEKIGCESVIHMDPVRINDEHVSQMRTELADALKALGDGVQVNEFRLVETERHVKVMFDCVVPFDVEPDASKASVRVRQVVRDLWPNVLAVVKINRPYT